MSEGAAQQAASRGSAAPVNDRAYLSIGEVLGLLQEEFPDVTISKIRFLESQGLIDPERTPSGYRKFYDADIERLRFILREQKDSYLPLKVIKDRLESGENTGPVIRPPQGGTDHITNGASVVGAADPMEDEVVPIDPAAAPDPPSSPEPAAAPPLPLDPMPKGNHPSAGLPLTAGASLTFEELVGASGLTPSQLARGGALRAAHRPAGRAHDVLRRRRRRHRQDLPPASCTSASSPATSACTATAPTGRPACSSR